MRVADSLGKGARTARVRRHPRLGPGATGRLEGCLERERACDAIWLAAAQREREVAHLEHRPVHVVGHPQANRS